VKAKSGTKPAGKVAGVKAAALVPLTERERAVQVLDRFTFGARPGDVDRVMAMGVEKWFEQQLTPDAIKDPALDKRLADFPTLNMSAGAGADGVSGPGDGAAGGGWEAAVSGGPAAGGDV
jgi:uncharacterized protein (DUF1800 family)